MYTVFATLAGECLAIYCKDVSLLSVLVVFLWNALNLSAFAETPQHMVSGLVCTGLAARRL